MTTDRLGVATYTSSVLHSKNGALVAFSADESVRLETILKSLGAIPRTFASLEALAASPSPFDFVIYHVVSRDLETGNLAWLTPHPCKLMLLVGDPRTLIRFKDYPRSLKYDFLMRPWRSDELTFRLSLGLSLACGESQDSRQPDQERHKPRVTIVDDDATTCTMLATIFARYGMDFDIASDGAEALKIAKACKPHVVLLDLLLPEIDGFEVLSSLKSHSETAKIRVVVLSGRTDGNEMVRAFRLGADDYMTKPYSPIELVARVRRLIPHANVSTSDLSHRFLSDERERSAMLDKSRIRLATR